jgi:capsular polysaccharide export protein
VGPFFRLLGNALRSEGHTVYRVNLNGADLLDWPRGDFFRGRREAWIEYIRQYAAARDVSDLVLFGDCRWWHRMAMNELQAWNPAVRIHVMEEGYIRPDWITLELNGVNGHSRLHDVNGRFAEVAEALQVPAESRPTSESPVTMGWRATLSYLSMFFLAPLFPHYAHHRLLQPHQEAGAWLGKLAMRFFSKHHARRLQTELIRSESPYYLLLLQIDADKQVQEHSPVRSMHELLERVIPSFAKFAPNDAKLVVKAHPLDPKSRKQHAFAEEVAREWGVSDRVIFLDGGELGALISHSRGCVTINSTSGISVLHRGKPLHVFGKAVYCGPGLTHPGAINDFWTTDFLPDPAQYEAFRRVVIARTQVNGNFYTEQGMAMALGEVTRRLCGASVAQERDGVGSDANRLRQSEAVSA